MKLLIDMNLSPTWCHFLTNAGYEVVHWSSIGDAKATDRFITSWAKDNGYTVFTHDLDFGTILAVTNAEGPSVIQVREHNVLPETMGDLVITALIQFEDYLGKGALITIDKSSLRARILPMIRQ
jgi:predicted nuclease of predicted toxin-antitoxin system